jgi:glutamine synthetase
MVRIIQDAGIPVHYHHHEVAGAAQEEIEMKIAPLVRAADSAQIIKYIIRMTAMNAGVSACFMPKPIFNHPGNGMHFHQILMKDGLSLFWKEGAYADLSDIALSYIAGLLKHAPALIALTNPSTNSFKRLTPGFEAPTRIFFGLANRSAAIRIPKYTNTKETKRFEFRPPDATANPYLAIAAQLMAGLDGIRDNLDPVKMGFGPFDEDITLWNDAKKKKLKEIPTSMPDALSALEKDYEFLLHGGVFTKEFIDNYIRLKRREYDNMMKRPTAVEFETYYNL